MSHIENGVRIPEAPWRGAMALGLTGLTGALLLSGCAAGEEPENPDPYATSVSEETSTPGPRETIDDNGKTETELLWDRIGEILEDPSTPQPKGDRTYDEFAFALGGELKNDGVITIGTEQFTCADIAELTNPDDSCSINSNRQQAFSVFGPELEKWLANSRYIPEDMPDHVAVTLALNIAENGLVPNFAGTHVPHEALIGVEALRLENPNNYGYVMSLEKYAPLYADVRYNVFKVDEQPPTIEEWQSDQVDSNLDSAAKPTPEYEDSTLMKNIINNAESQATSPTNTIVLDNIAYTCGEMLAHASYGYECDENDQQLLASLEEYTPAIAEQTGIGEAISVPIAFHLLLAEQGGYLDSLAVGSVATGLAEASPAGLSEAPEDSYIYKVAQTLGVDNPQLIGTR